jgi:hypothetical protein
VACGRAVAGAAPEPPHAAHSSASMSARAPTRRFREGVVMSFAFLRAQDATPT